MIAPTKDAAAASERVIIGELFKGGLRAPEIFEGIEAEYLAGEHMPDVFEALRTVLDTGKFVNVDRVRVALLVRGVEIEWLPELLKECASLATNTLEPLEAHLGRVRADFFYRTFHSRSGHARNAEELAESFEDGLAFRARLTQEKTRSPIEIVADLLARQDAIYRGDEVAGYEWGLGKLDAYTRIRPGGLHLVGGLAKSGKTHFMLSAVDHNLRRGVPVKVFSCEMGPDELWRRLMAKRTGVDAYHIHTPTLPREDFERIEHEASLIAESDVPLDIDEDATPSPSDIVNRTRLWKYRNKIPDGTGIVCVDFLQLLRLDNDRGTSEASAIKNAAYELARMAKDLKLAVCALVQLNRRAEDAQPTVAHLEGSGGPSQAAEAILLLDPMRFQIRRRGGDPRDAVGQDGTDGMSVILAAQRHGVSFRKIDCRADLSTSRFFESAPEYDDAETGVGLH